MKRLKERYSKIPLYHASEISEGIILNANENPFGPLPELIDYMNKFLGKFSPNRYPDSEANNLREAISKAYGVDKEEVTCGVGSDELLDNIIHATTSVDEYVMSPYPSFSMYSQFATLNDANYVPVPLTKDFSYDVEGIIEKAKEIKPKVILICNPNNPTGCVMSNNDIKKIALSTDAFLVVDEAYAEFGDNSAVELAIKMENVLVFRTFSKAYGLAAARVGYAISRKENIDILNVVKPPYNISTLSLEMATWAITNRDLYRNNIELIKKGREYLYSNLKSLDIEVWPSKANFLWCRLSDKVVKGLDEAFIFIRKMKFNGEPFYRITVGKEEENIALIKKIKELM